MAAALGPIGIALIGAAVTGAATAAVSASSKPKATPTPQVPLPAATPRTNSLVADALAARRGAAANQRTGIGGAESTTTAKNALLGRN